MSKKTTPAARFGTQRQDGRRDLCAARVVYGRCEQTAFEDHMYCTYHERLLAGLVSPVPEGVR